MIKMINEALQKLLDDYHVDRDFAKEVREGYRHPLEDSINNHFNIKPHYRYGGSLAKGTANINSCDIDLLCYFDSDCNMSVENIYDAIANCLAEEHYIFEQKNSALCVIGKIGESKWDTTVDIVPGKYTSNEDNKDVFLWCNKDKKRLKSNPDIQINKVKSSNYKKLIRILKLFLTNHNVKFKSFYLEIFIIDYISKFFEDGFTLYDELISFCEHYNDIGNVKLFDPANSANNISNIHSDYEFGNIRSKIMEFYNVLSTNDESTIVNCILNKPYDIDCAYLRNAKRHSFDLLNNTYQSDFLTIIGKYRIGEYWAAFNSSDILSKETEVKFEINIPQSLSVKDVKLVVTNSGYDAEVRHDCPRGNPESTVREQSAGFCKFVRFESTSFYGNHFVHALITTTRNKMYYSKILTVKVR